MLGCWPIGQAKKVKKKSGGEDKPKKKKKKGKKGKKSEKVGQGSCR